ncbi:hypothetical protein [Roseovarius sp. CH_XMU1461]|uniref:hypothetical protein n=1 Tax=Roseovarius sp. CH_XMU1461 TaxID=3107777 RepID=UPI0030090497
MKKLFLCIMGDGDSGKSTTWYALFGKRVQTSRRHRGLELFRGVWADVFLINGSPEETRTPLAKRLADVECRVVLCSVQYGEAGKPSFEYVFNEGYEVVVYWLNPGYHSANAKDPDTAGMVEWLKERGARVEEMSGKGNLTERVQTIKTEVKNWLFEHAQ